MKRRTAVVGAIGAAALAAAPAKEQFVGVWKLVSCVRTAKDGKVDHPYGENPIGRLTYDRAGRMSAQLMRPGRKSTVPPGVTLALASAPAGEIREAVGGFIAYFGAFDVDEKTATVVHHVQCCLVPSWVGTDLKRAYKFTGDRLLLSARSAAAVDLVWEREPS